jgi:hypothetical protein
MPTFNLKWANFNLAIRIKVNNGAVYIIALFSSFLYIVLTMWIKAAAENFLTGLGAIWAISATMLAQQHGANKLDVEAAKANAGANLNAIKVAAAGGTAPCDDPGKGAANG